MGSSLPIPAPDPWTVSCLCPCPSMIKAALLNSRVPDLLLMLCLWVPPATCFPWPALACLSHNSKTVFSSLSIYRRRTREGGAVWEKLRGVGGTRMCLCPSDCHSLFPWVISLALGERKCGKEALSLSLMKSHTQVACSYVCLQLTHPAWSVFPICHPHFKDGQSTYSES